MYVYLLFWYSKNAKTRLSTIFVNALISILNVTANNNKSTFN